MKRTFLLATAAVMLLFTACEKDSSDETGPEPDTEDYQPTTAGSTWQYSSTNSGTYTETATGTDTTVGGEKYFIIINTETGSRYINKTGGVYRALGYVAQINQSVELTYLKDAAVGTTWEETESFTYSSFTIPVIFKYTIASRDADKTVNNTTYKNVIGVELTITANSALLGGAMTVATGRQFYAKGVGNISGSLDFDALGTSVTDSTYLISADIKE